MQSNLPKPATLGTKKSGYCGEVAVMRRWGCNMTIFGRGEQHVMLFSPNKNCHQRTIWIKFPDHSWLVCQLLKKLAFVERFFWQLGTQCSGRCCCREVAGSGLVWLYIPFIFSSKFFAINDFPREGRLIISKVINR